MSYIFFLSSFLITNLLSIVFAKHPIVEISDGKIQGDEFQTENNKTFYSFQGIPYAAPPIGNLRLSNPEPPSKWNDTKNCSQKNILCVQIREYDTEFETEDCLILNVYTTKLSNESEKSDLSVMVYFYGGGFYIGNSTYDAYRPDFFMDYDVVIVTVNYRLGPFGFLSTGDSVIPGNFGMKDQQLALKWVRNNIRIFGGDPEKVTIFGNSAGAASVGYHMISDGSARLFRAAIMSSGSPLNSWSFQKNPLRIANLTAHFINDSKILETSEDLLEFFRSVPASTLKKSSLDVLALDPTELNQALNGYFYAPVMDSYIENGFLKHNIYESVEKGNFSHVPLMIGFTSEEFLVAATEGVDYFETLMKKADSKNELLLNDILKSTNDEENVLRGKLMYEIYAPKGGNLEENLARGVRYFSDQCMNNAVQRFATLVSNYANVFLYQFSYDGLMGNYTKKIKGADTVVHTEDANYIWRRKIPTANNMNIEAFPENDKLIHRQLLSFYTNFAKYLNPTPKNDNSLENIEWKTINSNGPNQTIYLDINTNLEIKTNPKFDTYNKWKALFIKYAVKPYNTF